MPTPERLARLADATVSELAATIRAVNAANGWDVEFDFTLIPQKIALIHSEIVEAHRSLTLAEARRELGDVIVRAVDLVTLVNTEGVSFGTLDFRYPGGTRGDARNTLDAEWLLDLHAHATDALESWRKAADEASARRKIAAHLHLLIRATYDLIDALGGNTQAILVEIIQANALREYRHGGRRA